MTKASDLSQSPTVPPIPKQKFNFGLRQLFYVTALISAGLALGPSTIALTLIVLFGWGVVFWSGDRKSVFVWLVLVGMFLCCAGNLFIPGMAQVREAVRRTVCHNNLKQIMLGILNYEAANGCFPTDRIVTTPDGQQLRHSWRVLILPHVEQLNVYEQYDFNEAWNGPNNSKLESEISPIWCCPSRKDRTRTTYKLVNGPGTAFEIGTQLGSSDVVDGCAFTIGLIEDTAHPVNWMEPGDFAADDAALVLNSVEKQACAHISEDAFERVFVGSQFALLDGSTLSFPFHHEEAFSPGAFLIADGMMFDRDLQGGTLVETKYHAYVALGIYIFLIVLPAFFLRSTPSIET